LIKSVADSLWLVADGKLCVFQGDLDDYQQWLRTRGKTAAGAGAKREAAARAPQSAGEAARARSGLALLRREMQQIETRIAAIAAQHASVEAALCEAPLDGALQAEHAELTRDAAAMEARWLEVGTALEAAEAQTEVSG
jgi:ATP-binding cassette subfamily F protein 3